MEVLYEIPINIDQRVVSKEVGFVSEMKHYLGATWPGRPHPTNSDWVIIDIYTWPKRLLRTDDDLLNVLKL